MDFVARSILIISFLSLTGCQLPYYLKSAYHQAQLLNGRVPIEKALTDPDLSETDRKKLELAQEVRVFSEKTLGLKASKNYSSFVKLDRDSVTYVVNASKKWKLEHYLWSYPFLGKMPYKGFFVKSDAEAEFQRLSQEDLDVHLRGVSAYSTLGWFNDPITSPMLRYSEEDFVDTLIHETVHVTLYIKNSADFNERLATFFAGVATIQFYEEKEGPNSLFVQKIKDEKHDSHLFSKFISNEIEDLKKWYLQQTERSESSRQERLDLIKKNFKEKLEPKLKTSIYKNFPKNSLNNARLSLFATYTQDLEDFSVLFDLSGRDYRVFLEHCRELEKHPNPEIGLKELISRLR